MTQTTAAAVDATRMDVVLLDAIVVSKTNPRKNFNQAKLDELTDSIRQKGVLQPILVRTTKAGRNVELVAGERRFRAARAAGLTEIPAVIRDLTDQEVLEIQVIENLQRDDLHPLEEAEGYRQLAKTKGYDVARIAEKIGRSVKYIYDRMKLTSLIPEAQKIFIEGRITAGHAILLARLKPEDQGRAVDTDGAQEYHRRSGVWEHETQLFGDDDDGPTKANPYAGLKSVSVRELDEWIAEHVKLEAGEVDQMLLPETAEVLEAAAEESVKLLRITRHDMTPEAVKGGPKVILGRSWQRADGKDGGKKCEHARLAMVVIGEDRGQAFQVCIAKDKCSVHWGALIRARKKSAQAAASGGSKKATEKEPSWKLAERQRQEREAAETIIRDRFNAAVPKILEAIAEKVKKAPTKSTGLLGDMLIRQVDDHYRNAAPAASRLVPRGTTTEDLVRHAAFVIITQAASNQWQAFREIPKLAKAFGVDTKKFLAPEPKAQTAAVKGKKPAATKKAKK